MGKSEGSVRPSHWNRVPVRTDVIRAGDDMVDVIRRFAGSVAVPGDVIVLAESPVAISQGRAIVSEKVRPGLLARFLCRFPQKHGSLATPQAMQLAVDEAGALRICLGAVAAMAGRLVGKRGVFFTVAGPGLKLIDDIAGTIPPYDDCVVLGPKNPQEVVDRIQREVGVGTVIADVNDIGCVDILATSSDVDRVELEAALRDNPSGNDDQQTPIVVLKRK